MLSLSNARNGTRRLDLILSDAFKDARLDLSSLRFVATLLSLNLAKETCIWLRRKRLAEYLPLH